MASVSKNEMMDIIRFPHLSTKCNNYFFMNVENIQDSIRNIPMSSEIVNYNSLRHLDIGDNRLHNVVVDMKKTSVEELLNKALEVVNSSSRIYFKDASSCERLQDTLRMLKKNVQYIFYNAGSLTEADVRLFNDLIAYMSLHMNQVVLFQPDEQLATYKTNDRFKTLENKINYNMLHIK